MKKTGEAEDEAKPEEESEEEEKDGDKENGAPEADATGGETTAAEEPQPKRRKQAQPAASVMRSLIYATSPNKQGSLNNYRA